ncbi:MAG TPA: hypothetical protein VII97_12180 [Anaerolineales bacterium]
MPNEVHFQLGGILPCAAGGSPARTPHRRHCEAHSTRKGIPV